MIRKLSKVYRPEVTKVLDEANGLISAVVSTESKDRDGDVIKAEGWNLDNFNRHPVMLANHDYHSLKSQIGVWEKMEVAGDSLHGVAKFFIGKGNDEADWAFELAKMKKLAFSVGFIPDMDKAVPLHKDDAFGVRGMEFNEQELLEVSAVTVPSNPDALQRIVKSSIAEPTIKEIAEEQLLDLEEKVDEESASISDDVIDSIVARVIARLQEAEEADKGTGNKPGYRRGPEDEEDDEDSDDDADEEDSDAENNADEDSEQDEEKSEAQSESDFDAYAVAVAAAEQALQEAE